MHLFRQRRCNEGYGEQGQPDPIVRQYNNLQLSVIVRTRHYEIAYQEHNDARKLTHWIMGGGTCSVGVGVNCL